MSAAYFPGYSDEYTTYEYFDGDYENSYDAVQEGMPPGSFQRKHIKAWVGAFLFAFAVVAAVGLLLAQFLTAEEARFAAETASEQMQNAGEQASSDQQGAADQAAAEEDALNASTDPSGAGADGGAGTGAIGGALAGSNMTTQETNAQKNAHMAAKLLLVEMPYSRTGLLKALQNQGFSREDAQYGVDKLNANWVQEAIRMAKQYVDTLDFTRDDLIDQLGFEGFTLEQAEAAATAVGL